MFVRIRNIFFDVPADQGGGGTESGGAPDAGATPEPSLADARREFLNNPPPILPSEDAAPVETDDALAAEVEEELLKPPAAAGTPPGVSPPVPAAPGTPDPYAEFGGREAVEEAARVQAALKTESGVRLMVAQALQALKYSPQQIRAALEGGPAIPLPGEPPPPEQSPFDIDDEEIVTGADLKRIVAIVAEQAAQQAAESVRGEVKPTVDAFQEQRQQQASALADATYTELLGEFGTTPEEQKAWTQQQERVKAYATQYIDPNDWSATGIRNALIRGHADFVAEQESLFKGYLEKKRKDRQATPANLGGGSPPGSEAPKEPQNLAEAKAAAKAAGFFN
jgi:hypothetical protein